MRLSQKLAVLCAAVAVLPLAIASVFVLHNVAQVSRSQADEHLRTGARAANSIYDKRLQELRAAAERLAEEIATRTAVSRGSADRDSAAAFARLQDLLPRAQRELNLDFLIVADPEGRVIARHNDRPALGETLLGAASKNPIAEKVIAEGTQLRKASVAGANLENEEQVSRLRLSSVARVERADGTGVGDALMLEAGAPVFAAGRFIGIVLIGQMLNTYHAARPGASSLETPLIAEIKQTVFRADTDCGILTSLGDTIVASNLPAVKGGSAADPQPALKGLRRSQTATEERLTQDGVSYAVRWEPIRSLDGAPLGAIGVAMPGEIADRSAASIRNTVLMIGAAALVLAGIAGFVLGRALSDRLTLLTEAASRMTLGELSTPVRDPAGTAPGWLPGFLARDEVTELTEQVDEMRDSFRQAIDRIRKR